VDLDFIAPNRFKIMFSSITECRELKTRDLAGKRIIEQNLTLNVDVDFIARNRFKIMFPATRECREFKTRDLARKRIIE